jgi:hypothetical protein
MDADDKLLADLRTRAMDPSLRTDEKVLPQLPLSPPATPEMISATEVLLARSLHPFLKRVYTEVANGGFGPGYGLLSLTPNVGSDQRSLSSEVREDGWPAWLLPLWNWGDAAWSCLDSTSPEGTIVTHDDVDGPTVTDFTIRSWLRAWADGVSLWQEIYDDSGREVTAINPFTRKPTVIKAPGRARGKKN